MASPLFSKSYRQFADALRQARLDREVTQVELARRLKKPQSYVSKIERLERRVDPAEFHDWLAALGLESDALYRQIANKIGQSANP